MPENTPGDPPAPFANIIISVVKCADGSALPNFYFKNLKTGQVVPSGLNQSLMTLYAAYPGFQFEISRQGYDATKHTLTSQEVVAKFAEVCLVDAPPPPPPPRGPLCILTSAAMGVDRNDEGAAAGVLTVYRSVREALLTTSRERRLVERYYSDDVGQAGISALNNDPDLRRDFLIFLMQLTPFLCHFIDAGGRAEALVSNGATLDRRLARDGIDIMQRFGRAAGGLLDEEVRQISEIMSFAEGKLAGEILTYLDDAT